VRTVELSVVSADTCRSSTLTGVAVASAEKPKSGFAGKRAAQQYAQEQELAVRLWPRLRVEPRLMVGDWWLRWFPAQDLAPATLENYAQQYRRHVHPRFGQRALAEITGLDLSEFVRRLREAGLAPSSVTVVQSVIRDLLPDAFSRGSAHGLGITTYVGGCTSA
jgi:hypothetical protein